MMAKKVCVLYIIDINYYYSHYSCYYYYYYYYIDIIIFLIYIYIYNIINIITIIIIMIIIIMIIIIMMIIIIIINIYICIYRCNKHGPVCLFLHPSPLGLLNSSTLLGWLFHVPSHLECEALKQLELFIHYDWCMAIMPYFVSLCHRLAIRDVSLFGEWWLENQSQGCRVHILFSGKPILYNIYIYFYIYIYTPFWLVKPCDIDHDQQTPEPFFLWGVPP